MEFCRWWIAVHALHGVALREACFSHSSAVRREAVRQVLGLEGKLREASAYSTVCPELARKAVCQRPPKRSMRYSKTRSQPRCRVPGDSTRR